MVETSPATATPDWANLPSGPAAYAMAMQELPEVFSAGQILGDGFAILKDKGMAVGREFLILDWTFHEGNQGEFVSMRIINPQGEKARINDGSTGICAQLRELTEKGITSGIHCPNGLRVSEYTIEDGSQAKTYYIAS